MGYKQQLQILEPPLLSLSSSGSVFFETLSLALAASPLDVLILIFFIKTVSLCCPGWSAVVQSQLTATSAAWVQVIVLPIPPEYLGLQVPTTTSGYFFFVFLVEMGFRHVGQSGLELLTLGDPPSLASQSIGITGVSHHAQYHLFKGSVSKCTDIGG